MSFENNIEKLFKSKLESFESPVNDAMWSNISSSIGVLGASKSGSTSLISKLFSTTGVAISTGLICTIATVLVMSSGGNNSKAPPKKERAVVSTETAGKTNQQITNDDELAVSNILNNAPVDSNDPSVKEKKAESFIVAPSGNSNRNNSAKAPSSIINSFLTPKSRTKHTKPVQEPARLENKVVEEKEITIIQAQEGELIATIIASPVGGYAPLDVYFSNPATRGSVLWNFGDGTSSEDFSPSHTFEEYGTYTIELIVTDASGEEKKDYRVIEVEANSAITVLPNVFTPNGDGMNDFCTVKGKNLAVFQMKVFNRSGSVIFESQSIDNSWDGKDKFGEDITTGTYFYLISARGIDGKVYEHTGSITLSR